MIPAVGLFAVFDQKGRRIYRHIAHYRQVLAHFYYAHVKQVEVAAAIGFHLGPCSRNVVISEVDEDSYLLVGSSEFSEPGQQHIPYPELMRLDGGFNRPLPIRNDVTPDDEELRTELSCGFQEPVKVTRMHMRVGSAEDLNRGLRISKILSFTTKNTKYRK